MTKKTTGAVVAAAVAGLFLAGKAMAQDAAKAAGAKTEAKKIHCEGVNECKGKGACKGAENSCAGKNGCKGKAWMEMTQADCDAAKAKMKKG